MRTFFAFFWLSGVEERIERFAFSFVSWGGNEERKRELCESTVFSQLEGKEFFFFGIGFV